MAGFPRTSYDRYRDSLSHVKPLSREVERQCALDWANGDERAGVKLIEASLPFVIRIAREYRRWGVPLEDLVQQGNLGLLKAAKKFDPERDCRLVTYAAYWIRAEIRDYVVRGYRIVRLGTTRTERRAMRLFRRRGFESVEELIEESGMPPARAKKLWPLLTRGDVSLDVTYDDRGPGVDRVPGALPTPEDVFARNEEISGVRAALREALTALTDRERRIVNARAMASEPRTLADLGKEMGVSKERIRQLEARAHGKLRVQLAPFRSVA